MKINEVMFQLDKLGNEQTKKIFLRHGAREPFYGVKVGDLKKLVKKIKIDHQLSLELFATGNSDAMYLAGLIADPDKITKTELQNWVENAYWYMISEYTVPDVAAASKYGTDLGLTWIESDKEMIAAAGWATLSRLLTPKSKFKLKVEKVKALLTRIEQSLQSSQNRVKYAMNGFLIAAGTYYHDLTENAISIAGNIGKVDVEMGNTYCKVPDAAFYIKKAIVRNSNKK